MVLELYFCSWGRGKGAAIMYLGITDGQWSEPQIVSFSGDYRDWDQNLSPDGKRIFFSSLRPEKKGEALNRDADLWFVEQTSSDFYWVDAKVVYALNKK